MGRRVSAKKSGALKSLALALGILLLGLAPSGDLSAELYRYVDKDGNVHITDTPPTGGRRVQVLRSGPGEPVDVEREGKTPGFFAVPFRRMVGSLGNLQGIEVEVTLTKGYRSITRQFVVDTGASSTVITLADAKELGVEEGDVSGSSLGVVPGGGRILAHHVPLDGIKLGNLEIEDPVVAVIKGGGMRLLGIDLLGRFDLELKNEQQLIILKAK
jgi:clan AA aspartic protease (TIGR02281 family)